MRLTPEQIDNARPKNTGLCDEGKCKTCDQRRYANAIIDAYLRVKQTLSHYEQTDGSMRFTAEAVAAELRLALYEEES